MKTLVKLSNKRFAFVIAYNYLNSKLQVIGKIKEIMKKYRFKRVNYGKNVK